MKPQFAIALSLAFGATLSLAATSALALSDRPPSPSQLVAQSPNQWALEDTLQWYFRDDYFDEIFYHFTEFDLNGDGLEEAIVSYTQTEQCNNRSCPVHIFKPAEGGAYDLIGDLWGQKGTTQVALLRSKTSGWYDLAIPVFDRDPRGLYWRVAKFNGDRYEMTDLKFASRPRGSRIILDLENSPTFTIRKYQSEEF